MTVPTSTTAGRRRRVRRRLMVAIPVLIALALAVIVAFSTSTAAAHPSYGQPCGRSGCHTPTTASKVTLVAKPTSTTRGKTVKLSGKVANGRAGLKARVQISTNGKTWKTYKTLVLGAARTCSTTWKSATKVTRYFRLYYLGDNVHKTGASAKVKVVVK
jgi:hypothetical protein